ncbi:Vitamin B12 dependent methionine synthase activation subunit [Desulfurispora thermophila]|uniref:Vitamin B12 dependent methionine synthase activation subunit n=1 Tax=Desulfurispora thermophila TaxID=265470 RepID=UPI001FA76F2A|nr:Vitamin B12 dependent methionine synthase activation subunit [Desulfurispora thermophila]
MDYYKLNVQISEDDVSRTGWGPGAGLSNANSRSLLNEILQEALELARAEAVCRVVPVLGISDSKIFLAGGQALTSKLLVRLACTAQSLFLAVCTLGREIDRRVEEYSRAGLTAHAYFLDIAGTCIIEAAGRQLVSMIKEQLASSGLQITIPLGPGHSYWESLQDQQIIYDLVNPTRIGVSILESGVMLPKKSVSMVMGIGHQLPPSAANHCHYCSMGQKCPLSRVRQPN